MLAQQPGERRNDRRFAAAAHRKIANADDGM
jgi:hypothetical protein